MGKVLSNKIVIWFFAILVTITGILAFEAATPLLKDAHAGYPANCAPGYPVYDQHWRFAYYRHYTYSYWYEGSIYNEFWMYDYWWERWTYHGWDRCW